MVSTAQSAAATQNPSEQLLLFSGLMLMANADGVVDQRGLAALEAFCKTVPALAARDFDELLREACKLQARYETLLDSVQALDKLDSPAARVKLFVLAVDLAMSTGELDPHEQALLESVAKTLRINEETAVKTVSVLSLKYRR